MAHQLERDPDVAQKHTQGLRAAQGGQFEIARINFIQAEGMLSVGDTDSVANRVQLAGVLRDHGFASIGEAVQSEPAEHSRLFTIGFSRMRQAESLTLPHISAGISTEINETVRREIITEHATTIGALGRTVLAKQVLYGLLTRGISAGSEQIAEQAYFGAAYSLACLGNNAYYTTTIAMHGARAELINGRRKHVGPWLKRAISSAARAASSDPENAAAARHAVVAMGRHLRSRPAALASVKDWRTI
jgi:hypothetical protein